MVTRGRLLPTLAMALMVGLLPSFVTDRGQGRGLCPRGTTLTGSVGIVLHCRGCTIRKDRIAPGWDLIEHRLEPFVGAIEEDSPSEGVLQVGDDIVAADSLLITSKKGSRRFSHLVPGEPVLLRVRRQGGEIEVGLIPEPKCLPVIRE